MPRLHEPVKGGRAGTRRCTIAAAVAILGCAIAARAGEPAPQRASAADMRSVFEPIIGEFRSPDQLFDDGKTGYYFRVSYQWFDAGRTIVRFTVTTVIPSQSRLVTNAEGFYWLDPLQGRIAVFGAFANGMTGTGAISRFDTASGRHEVRATSIDGSGAVTHVRDAFEILGPDAWRNVTRVQAGDDPEWRVVHDETYSREKG
jgi:hypothetical protein